MDELRLVRREEQSLVVATEAGEEYRLIVDETLLAELRHLSRPSRGARNISPREVQALVRAGKTREEISKLTGVEESDIERYEEPVLAERRYILELARKVPVRTGAGEDSPQEFGTAIAERLIGIGAQGAQWSSWRDEEAGWMIGLEFDARDVSHRAVWSFEHRKGLLTPITADATTLSRQGDLGDRLIPKLRAVDANERFDSGAFDVDALRADPEDSGEASGAERDEYAAKDPDTRPASNVAPDHPSTGSIPIVDAEAEYARRKNIEDRAIKTPEPEIPDLGQTADLLDALRRRRGERESEAAGSGAERGEHALRDDAEPRSPIPISGLHRTEEVAGEPVDDASDDEWELVEDGALFDTSGAKTEPANADADADDAHDTAEVAPVINVDETIVVTRPEENDPDAEPRGEKKDEAESRRRGKGRASIPSWDDILFGTRSEDDPA